MSCHFRRLFSFNKWIKTQVAIPISIELATDKSLIDQFLDALFSCTWVPFPLVSTRVSSHRSHGVGSLGSKPTRLGYPKKNVS